jgi:hypothetical protein
MRYTLLEMTQSILSSMDSDQVNSINDTVEAQQVASVIKNAYYDIISPLNLPELYDFFELTATSSVTPTVMTLPTNVMQLDWIKYDQTESASKDYLKLDYVDLVSFTGTMHSIVSTEDNVDTFTLLTNGSDTVEFLCYNDVFPTKYTTFNDNTIIFDSYNKEFDAFLQKNKTLCWGQLIPAWSNTDGFIPDLDPKQFTLLLNEAKGQAFIEMKQQVNAKAEKRARRGWINSQKTKRGINGLSNGRTGSSYNFGRK